MRRASQLLRFQALLPAAGQLEHAAAREQLALRPCRLRALWQQQAARGLADAAPSSKTTSKSPVTFQTLFWTLFGGAAVVAGVRQYQESRLKGAMSKTQQVSTAPAAPESAIAIPSAAPRALVPIRRPPRRRWDLHAPARPVVAVAAPPSPAPAVPRPRNHGRWRRQAAAGGEDAGAIGH
jgi:hypothetical protein